MEDSARPAATLPVFRFGAFALDVRTGELSKGGIRIRLQDQPLQILLILLERPGDLVLREQIRERLWPDDTVVEFDHGINTAVKRLRDALGESALKPRYIETLPRRGYRFIARIEGPPEPNERHAPVDEGREGEPPTPASESIAHSRASLRPVTNSLGPGARATAVRRRWPWLVAGLCLLLSTIAALWPIMTKRQGRQGFVQPVPLTSYPGQELQPSFSPDGNEVAFM